MAKRVSSWKQKKTFTVVAPDNFNNRVMGTSIAADPKMLIGRTIKVSLKDLTDERSKQHMKLTFEIKKVEGSKAFTRFKSFGIAPGYMRYKVRKGTRKIDYIHDMILSDKKVRITIIVISNNASKSQVTQVKKGILNILNEHTEKSLDQFVQLMLFGKLGTELYHSVKSICPISRVEIEKIKVL